jgi:hypothetical protein
LLSEKGADLEAKAGKAEVGAALFSRGAHFSCELSRNAVAVAAEVARLTVAAARLILDAGVTVSRGGGANPVEGKLVATVGAVCARITDGQSSFT